MAYNTPEGKVKKRGRDICKELGLYFFPVNQGGMSLSGIPDDVLCVGGMFIHIEYKAHMRWDKNNKTAHKTLPSDLQVRRMEECRASGGITFVVDDTNIDKLKLDLVSIQIFTMPSGIKLSTNDIVNYEYFCKWCWCYTDYLLYKQDKLEINIHGNNTIPHPTGCLLKGIIECEYPQI